MKKLLLLLLLLAGCHVKAFTLTIVNCDTNAHWVAFYDGQSGTPNENWKIAAVTAGGKLPVENAGLLMGLGSYVDGVWVDGVESWEDTYGWPVWYLWDCGGASIWCNVGLSGKWDGHSDVTLSLVPMLDGSNTVVDLAAVAVPSVATRVSYHVPFWQGFGFGLLVFGLGWKLRIVQRVDF